MCSSVLKLSLMLVLLLRRWKYVGTYFQDTIVDKQLQLIRYKVIKSCALGNDSFSL